MQRRVHIAKPICNVECGLGGNQGGGWEPGWWVVEGRAGVQAGPVWFPPVSSGLGGTGVVGGGGGARCQAGPGLVSGPRVPGPYLVLKHSIFGRKKYVWP